MSISCITKTFITNKFSLDTTIKLFLLAFIILLRIAGFAIAKESYNLVFSTYVGGSGFEHARDIFVDNNGYIYLVGGTASSNFPTTPGAYDRTFDSGYTGSFGPCDVFVSKFSSNGNLIWSTFIGGPNYDRAYAVEVDSQGYVYVSGRAGQGFPIKNGFQSTFQGVGNPTTGYGMQNGFVAKLLPDGSDLVWSSYVGVNDCCRDLAIDNNNDIYVPLVYFGSGGTPPSGWFANAYQKNPKGGSECGAVKIKSDGSQVLWATWLGGTSDEYSAASIRVDANKNVYLAISTQSSDIPTTPGAHDRTFNGDIDFYIAKLTPEGSGLIWGTFLGDLSQEWTNTHNLALDDQGNAYVSVHVVITPINLGYPTTVNAFQTVYRGGNSDIGISKFDSATGALVASTLLGGSGDDNADGIYVDGYGNVYITGDTSSTDFPVTINAYQSNKKGGREALWAKLSGDFSQLLYCTYMGGNGDDLARNSFLGQDGKVYLGGSSTATGWPILNAFQPNYGGGPKDAILAKFTPAVSIPGTLQFSASVYNANEDDGTVTITVSRSNGSDGTVSVNYATSDDTATAGVDYTATSGTLNWADGEAVGKTFIVPIIDDTDIEGNEKVKLTLLSNPTGGAILGSPATAILTIVENEPISRLDLDLKIKEFKQNNASEDDVKNMILPYME